MPQKFKRILAKYYFILRPLTVIFLATVLVFLAIKITPPLVNSTKKVFSLPSVIYQVLFNRGISLKKADHRINLLILGMAGGNHDGSELTDSMIFTSIDPDKNDILLISIPRDIWIDSMKAKINTAYFYGEEKKVGGGFILAKAAVNEIFDQPVDYTIKIDFDGFKKVVNLLDGIEVDVENSLNDYKYPISGKENDDCGGNDPEYKCRYEHISFKKGKQQMDGETALKFVRSRYAEGLEGTDFARSKRQQKVILAIKDKVFSLSTIFSPTKVRGLINILGESMTSDIKNEEIDDFIRLVKNLRKAKIRTLVIDEGDEEKGKPGLLMSPPTEEYDGIWVLVPRSEDWQEIQGKIKKQLSN